MEPTEKRGPNKIALILIAVMIFIIGIVATNAGNPSKPLYQFVTADHPVEMWKIGHDKWAYFFIGGKSLKVLGDKARKELTPLGFIEDSSENPWIRFVKDTEEIVICNHQDFGVNISPNGLILTHGFWPKGVAKPTEDTPSILVKNGPSTEMPLWNFGIKKFILRW